MWSSAPDQADEVVLHQDFHGGNILRGEREPWLVIDPKPLVGEPAFDAARSPATGAGSSVSRGTLPASVAVSTSSRRSSSLDRERVRRWGIAHALIWGFSDSKVEADMIESARLLVDAA